MEVVGPPPHGKPRPTRSKTCYDAAPPDEDYNVFLNGRLVGKLRLQANGALDFQYDDDWPGWEQAFPVPLSLPLREDCDIGDPVNRCLR